MKWIRGGSGLDVQREGADSEENVIKGEIKNKDTKRSRSFHHGISELEIFA